MYPNVQNIHLKTELQVQEICSPSQSRRNQREASGRIIHHYSVYLGPYSMQCGYGILVSENMSVDESLVEDAKKFQALLKTVYPSLFDHHSGVDDKAVTGSMLKHLIQQLSLLKKQSCPSFMYCRQFFHRLLCSMPLQQRRSLTVLVQS